MKLRLKDRQNSKDAVVDIKVDYSYMPKDMLVIFRAEATVCGLDNNKNTSPYDEYIFKKVQNIIVGSFKYENHSYTLKLGEYLNGNYTDYFIISEEGDSRYITFDDDTDGNEIRYQSFTLCDYNEYKEVCEITGSEILSKNDFISGIFGRYIISNDYTLYNTIPKQNDFNLFINSKDFSAFLDSEEVRTSN